MKLTSVIVFVFCLSVAPLLVTADDVIGKLVVGYQGWFGAKGDKSPRDSWIHWVDNTDHPYKDHQKFELWPDTSEYTTTYQTGYAALGNGKPAKLFSSWDKQTVDTHFKWMQQVCAIYYILYAIYYYLLYIYS
jgi:hypothetical protein